MMARLRVAMCTETGLFEKPTETSSAQATENFCSMKLRTAVNSKGSARRITTPAPSRSWRKGLNGGSFDRFTSRSGIEEVFVLLSDSTGGDFLTKLLNQAISQSRYRGQLQGTGHVTAVGCIAQRVEVKLLAEVLPISFEGNCQGLDRRVIKINQIDEICSARLVGDSKVVPLLDLLSDFSFNVEIEVEIIAARYGSCGGIDADRHIGAAKGDDVKRLSRLKAKRGRR